ncbi:NUDIX hydrolase [Promicromonospora iranensis]|uniref:8-oxo-dGTP diphosphatase n=1 Tax=Promicromonospora iranensis TaxID=1105144 RepID=A0ABU2CRA9_9MICO|nr:NUDIX hydrolase [Promicromonospora iranensis]MDR7383877.1 8-oxo-dGTP diphosphatase [Promicromonospora iranensis]
MPEASPAIAAAVIVQDGKLLLVRRRVAEGSLSWQFPAGAVEQGETFDEAAVREAAEEVGLNVQAVIVLGERLHPSTGRLMGYVACDVVSGEAYVADAGELAGIVWATLDRLTDYVPNGFAPAVQDYLTTTFG